MTADPGLQQEEVEEAAARIGILRHDGRYPDFFAGFEAAAESRDQRITQLEKAIAELQADHRRSPTFPLQLWKSWHTLDALQAGAVPDPDVADTAWAIIAHHRQHRTGG